MNRTKNYDVVVVGAGNAAMCAAIAAKEKGADVLVLERGPAEKRGGNSFFTDGAIRVAYDNLDAIRKIIPDLRDEEAEKIVMPEYTQSDFYDDLMRVTEGKSDPDLANQLISKSFETLLWMSQQGIKFELNVENQSFEQDGKRHFWGGLPIKTEDKGVGLIKSLFQRAEEIGIDLWYNSRATQLVTVNDRITGINIEQDGEILTISTSSVILACGSFEANKKMRSEHLGEEWEAAIVRGTEFNTGDGITMALAVGAQRYGEWNGCHSIGTDYNAPKFGDFNKPGDIFKKSSFPLGLLINQEGKRFVDEGADFRNYTYAKYGREVLKQPGHSAFQLFDAQVRPMLRKEYNLEEATYIQADSLEELAEKMSIDKEPFLKTITDYNTAVQEGDYNPTIKDGKGTVGIAPPKTNWALRIDQAPFYAYPVTCGITFAFGGLHVNENGEVLNYEGSPIGGLYAAGEMVGGIFYKNYPGGSGLMSGAVFGKISGTSAAKFSKSKLGIS
ncbi:FAD-dependent tricarballylate dehydrogenase TcuA [Metabacillus sediminilitoris]|uniref:FAD-binding dehydrogenase n=1 Tax=Metabacillus sediminilitoris TaxID=2567941 RepID=A0A4S4BX09_9BACI|nr:FAD-dependent tricarballylate dehydrogenase TcuA [Metabacillus sediminilitoris]QGQ45960.1 FAD-dependent oxidoreductase [Metabacillus sediminilitoris]THF79644.1 FAD-binding dehydrogenase [Metabacillus sediminilitoris]